MIAPIISHMLYANDLLIACRANIRNAKTWLSAMGSIALGRVNM